MGHRAVPGAGEIGRAGLIGRRHKRSVAILKDGGLQRQATGEAIFDVADRIFTDRDAAGHAFVAECHHGVVRPIDAVADPGPGLVPFRTDGGEIGGAGVSFAATLAAHDERNRAVRPDDSRIVRSDLRIIPTLNRAGENSAQGVASDLQGGGDARKVVRDDDHPRGVRQGGHAVRRIPALFRRQRPVGGGEVYVAGEETVDARVTARRVIMERDARVGRLARL